MKERIALALMLAVCFFGGSAMAEGGLSLGSAMDKAFAEHPSLAAARAEIDSKEGAALQADLIPNPELELEVGELGADEGSDVLETSLSITQPLELGGKRSKRFKVASIETKQAQTDLETFQLDLETAVKEAFLEALAAQEKVRIQKELLRITEETVSTISEKVRTGKVSPVEEVQAKLEATATRIELKKAESELLAAKAALAGLWGGNGQEINEIEGGLGELAPPPSYETLKANLDGNINLKQMDNEIALGEAARELELAGRIPDLSLTGGVTTIGQGDETTYSIGISIPLSIFDRNQGAVAESVASLSKARAEKRAAKRSLHAETEGLYQKVKAFYEEAKALREMLLPAAEQSYESVQEGYKWGKFDYISLLEAQRTLLEARVQLVEAQVSYRMTRIALDRLTATGFETKSNL